MAWTAPAAGLAASNPVKSEVFAGLALLVLSLIVLLILRYYLPLRTTPAYLLVPVFFALWLPANIVLLVPIDLASSSLAADEVMRGIWLPERVLRVSWKITYWLTFCLTWFILPVLAEYADAGYREPKDRVLYSLRQNGQYYLLVFGSGIAGLVYIVVTHGYSATSLKGLVMALAYCWGLILAIYLMGHGLVSIPRRILRTAAPSHRLRRLQDLAPRLFEKLEEAEMDLEDVEQQVAELGRRKTGSALDFRAWIDELCDSAGPGGAAAQPPLVPAPVAPLPTEGRTVPVVITKKYMADLTRRLVRARHARSRYLSEWHRLLEEYTETQAILNSAGSKRLDFGRARQQRQHQSRPQDALDLGAWAHRLSPLTPYTRYVLYFHVVPRARVAVGVVLAVASAAIVWSELVKAALPEASVVRLTVVHHWTRGDAGTSGQVGFAGQLLATGWILYMCAAALISVTEVKVWRGRALVKRNTAHESAFWYASQVARLSIPLSYNFLTFLSKTVYEETVFYDFLGRYINLTRLGTWFDYLFPVFILLPVLATLFGLYGRVRRFFGFGRFISSNDNDDDDDDNGEGVGRLRNYGTGSWREGRDLIERELDGTSLRQRRLEAAASAAGGRRANGYRDQADLGEDGTGAAATTPFAMSPSNSGILSPAAAPSPPPHRTRTLGTGGGASSSSSGTRPARARGFADAPAAADEDENFFQLLGHRMKNSIDGFEAPRWFQDNLKKPRWMAGGGGESSGGGSGSGSNDNGGDGGGGIRRWFGGSDNRIRL